MTDDDDQEAIRRQFGRRLQQLLNQRGWNQSELARRMAPLMKHSRIGRDNISKYVRGKVLPLPHALEVMATVLEVKSTDLLPERRDASPQSNVRIQDLGDGTSRLRVDRVVPTKVAAKIYGILAEGTAG